MFQNCYVNFDLLCISRNSAAPQVQDKSLQVIAACAALWLLRWWGIVAKFLYEYRQQALRGDRVGAVQSFMGWK